MSSVFAEFNAFKALLQNVYEAGESESISELVFEEILQQPFSKLRMQRDLEIGAKNHQRLQEIRDRLLAGEPVQYILGFAWFKGGRYLVNPDVLIPRPETEELVDWAAECLNANKNARVLDIGTGSGCIAIGIKQMVPDAEVFAIDISEAAINTARMNALHILDLKDEKGFMVRDIFDHDWWGSMGNFDLIISNPPYITEEEKAEMHQNVLGYEPETALFVPNEDPLKYYREIAEFADQRLNSGGYLFFEANARFGHDLQALLTSKDFADMEVRQDMQGKERMFCARKA